VELRVKTQKVK